MGDRKELEDRLRKAGYKNFTILSATKLEPNKFATKIEIRGRTFIQDITFLNSYAVEFDTKKDITKNIKEG